MDQSEVEKVLSQFSKNELKRIMREALREWLDEQTMKFGRWTLRWIVLASIGMILYFVLIAQGWTHK